MSVTNEMLSAALDEFDARPYTPFENKIRAAIKAAMRAAWIPVDTTPIDPLPEDRPVLVWCPPRDGLPEMYAVCQWHPGAGFTVSATHWRPLPGGPEERFYYGESEMSLEDINKAAVLADAFLKAINGHEAPSKESGALRRASMELTRALAQMRKP